VIIAVPYDLPLISMLSPLVLLMETIFLSDVDHLIFFLFFTLDVAFKVKEVPFFKFLEAVFSFRVVLASLVIEKVNVQTSNSASVIMAFKYLFFINSVQFKT
jgi:hypothetical protein